MSQPFQTFADARPELVERLERAGGRRVTLGPRILRVETATVALLARLSPS